MIRVEALDPFARAAATALGLDFLEAAALVALVLAAAAVLRSSATTRHVLWWIALAACAALPLASICSSFDHVEHRAVARAAAPATAGREHERTAGFRGSRTAAPVPGDAAVGDAAAGDAAVGGSALSGTALGGAPADAVAAGGPAGTVGATLALAERGWGAVASAAGLPYAATVVVAVWLGVASLGWTRLALSLIALARIKRDALPLNDSVVRRLRRWRHSARTGRAVALAVSNDVDVPVAVGFRTPTILLPAAVVENQEIADIDQIAMHEYAHLERYDDWTNLLQRVIECALWFNPIVTSFIGRRISLEREVACDDWVIAQTGRAHRYATCLWKLVESSRLPAKPIVAPGVLLSPKEITVRIERLLDSRRNALPRLSPLGTLAVGALALAGAVFAAQHAPAVALTDAPCPPAARATNATKATTTATAATAATTATTANSDRAQRVPAPHPVAAPVAEAHPHPAAAVDVGALRAIRAALALQEPHPKLTLPELHPKLVLPEPYPKLALRDPRWKVALAEPQPKFVLAESLAVPAHDAETARAAQLAQASRLAEAAQLAKAAQPAVPAQPSQPARPLHERAEPATEPQARAPLAAVAEAVGLTVGTAVSSSLRAVAQAGFGEAPATLDRASLDHCGGCDLHGRDLRGLDLHDLSLAGADLRGADLRGVNLSGANLAGDELNGARFDDANLAGATIEGCDLRGASFAGANLEGIHLAGTSIRGALFKGSQLRAVVDRCEGCDLRGFDLRGIDLHGIRLDGADLRGADLRNADLSGAHLTGVDLREAKLDGTNLRNAVLRGCSLRGTDRSHADTTGAYFDASDDD
jgi:uncharacterized protein YjbI with pentapeptide repeats/beta-lactamase regulating signal transducer with metallopeptidase domain